MKDFSEIRGTSRTEKYEQLLQQSKEIIKDIRFPVSAMAHICACLKEYFGHLWVGYYIKFGNELLVGPYQGPPACLRIPFGKGVCGTAWKENRTLIVPDVDAFPGHIACSSLSKSEIVIPLYDSKNNFYGVLDIDSEHYSFFNETDAYYLEKINDVLRQRLVFS